MTSIPSAVDTFRTDPVRLYAKGRPEGSVWKVPAAEGIAPSFKYFYFLEIF